MTIGEFIKYHRKWYNQKGFAEDLGVSQPHLSHLELGHRLPSMKVLRKLSKISGKRLPELLEMTYPE